MLELAIKALIALFAMFLIWWLVGTPQLGEEPVTPTPAQAQADGRTWYLPLITFNPANVRLPATQVPAAAASPGYTIELEDGHWVLPRRRPGTPMGDSVRIPIPE